MLTRIQHAAIVSENFVGEARFYEAVFGMKHSKPGSAPEMRERIVSEPAEGERRLALIATCGQGQHQFSRPDGVFVDVSEK
jgi:hypothetical protein